MMLIRNTWSRISFKEKKFNWALLGLEMACKSRNVKQGKMTDPSDFKIFKSHDEI